MWPFKEKVKPEPVKKWTGYKLSDQCIECDEIFNGISIGKCCTRCGEVEFKKVSVRWLVSHVNRGMMAEMIRHEFEIKGNNNG